MLSVINKLSLIIVAALYVGVGCLATPYIRGEVLASKNVTALSDLVGTLTKDDKTPTYCIPSSADPLLQHNIILPGGGCAIAYLFDNITARITAVSTSADLSKGLEPSGEAYICNEQSFIDNRFPRPTVDMRYPTDSVYIGYQTLHALNSEEEMNTAIYIFSGLGVDVADKMTLNTLNDISAFDRHLYYRDEASVEVKVGKAAMEGFEANLQRMYGITQFGNPFKYGTVGAPTLYAQAVAWNYSP